MAGMHNREALKLCIINLNKDATMPWLDDIFQVYSGQTMSIVRSNKDSSLIAFIKFPSVELREEAFVKLNMVPPHYLDIQEPITRQFDRGTPGVFNNFSGSDCSIDFSRSRNDMVPPRGRGILPSCRGQRINIRKPYQNRDKENDDRDIRVAVSNCGQRKVYSSTKPREPHLVDLTDDSDALCARNTTSTRTNVNPTAAASEFSNNQKSQKFNEPNSYVSKPTTTVTNQQNSDSTPQGHNITTERTAPRQRASRDLPNNLHRKGDRFKNLKEFPVPKEKFSPVFVSTILNKSTFYVQSDFGQAFSQKFATEMHSIGAKQPPLNKFTIGSRCMTFVDGMWCRGEIISVNPPIAKILFIDYGNKENIEVSLLKEVPDQLLKQPPCAFKVKLLPHSLSKNLKIELYKPIYIQPLRFEDDLWLVDAENHLKNCENEELSLTNSSHSNYNTPNIPSKKPESKPEIKPERKTEAPAQDLLRLPLPPGEFSEVIVTTVISPGMFYVQATSNVDKLIQMESTIQKNIDSTPALKIVAEKGKCLAPFKEDGNWYRALIKSVDDKRIVIFFVDYGNLETYQKNEFKELPLEIKKIKPMAFKIKLSTNTPKDALNKKYGEKFKVMIIEKRENEDFWLCELSQGIKSEPKINGLSLEEPTFDWQEIERKLNDNDSALKEACAELVEGTMKSPETNSQSAVCPLPLETFTDVIVSTALAPNIFYVHSAESVKKLWELQQRIDSVVASLSPLKVVYLNSKCLALSKSEFEWYRAKVINIDDKEVKVRFIDYGNESLCSKEELRELPSDLKVAKPLAYKIKLSEATSSKHFNKKFGDKFKVKPLAKREGDVWIVDIEGADSKLTEEPISYKKVTSSQSSGTLTQLRIPSSQPKISEDIQWPADLEKFSTVIITNCVENDVYYGHLENDLEKITQTLIITQKESVNAPVLKDLIVGKMCLVLYLNDWYRAKILSIKPKVTVQLLDYGDVFEPQLSDLKVISEPLKNKPILTFKFKLSSQTSNKYHLLVPDSKIIVKPVEYSSLIKAWIVDVEGEPASTPSKSVAAFNSLESDTNSHLSSSKDTADISKTPSQPSSVYSAECPLNKDEYSCVVISSRFEKNVYCGYSDKDTSKISEIHALAQKEGATVSPLKNPAIGAICLVPYLNEWYRARILSTSPSISVQLVDFGDILEMSPEMLKDISVALKSKPISTFKFKLSASTSDQYFNKNLDDKIVVKPVKFSEEVKAWIVDVEGEPITLCEESPSKPKTCPVEKPIPAPVKEPSTIKSESVSKICPLKENEFSYIFLTCCVQKNVYYGCNICNNDIVSQIFNDTQTAAVDAPALKHPVVGPCLVLFCGDWYRGEILSTDPSIKVQLWDYGDIFEAKPAELKVLPEILREKEVYTFKCKLASQTSDKYFNLEPNTQLCVKPVKYSEQFEAWILDVEGEPPSVTENLTKEHSSPLPSCSSTHSTPKKPSQSRSDFVPKHCPMEKNKFNPVIITCCEQSGIYYGILKSNCENYALVLEDTAKCSVNAQSLTNPVIGDMCLTLYLGDWYRANILSTSPDIKVQLVEYGDIISSKLQDLKELPEDLKNKPVYTFKFQLSAVTPDKYFNLPPYDNIIIKPIKFEENSNAWYVDVAGEPSSPEIAPECLPNVPEDQCRSKLTSQIEFSPAMLEVCPIKQDSFSSIFITCCEKYDVYYGLPSHLNEEVAEVHSYTQEVAKKAPLLTNVEVGSICLAPFMNDWYRVRILNVSSTISVQLIDFGDVTECSVGDLKIIPEGLKKQPIHLFKLKFSDQTPVKYFDREPLFKISVKPLRFSEESKAWIVDVEEEPNTQEEFSVPEPSSSGAIVVNASAQENMPSQSAALEPPKQEECPLDLATFTSVVITSCEKENTYYGYLEDHGEEVIDTHLQIQKVALKAPEATDISVGSICLAPFMNDWYRVKVLAVSTSITVQLLDFGDITSCTLGDLKKLPEDLIHQPVHTFKFQLSAQTSDRYFNQASYSKISIKPVRFSDQFKVWIVDVEGEPTSSPEEFSTSSGQPANQSNKQNVPNNQPKDALSQYVPPSESVCPIGKNEFTKVNISHPVTKDIYYGQKSSLMEPASELFDDLQKEVPNSPSLLNPKQNDFCAVFFDGSWYRGKILATCPDVTVQMIDFGDVFVPPLETLKQIPDKFKTCAPYAFKFKLSESVRDIYHNKKLYDEFEIKPVRYEPMFECWIVDVLDEAASVNKMKLILLGDSQLLRMKNMKFFYLTFSAYSVINWAVSGSTVEEASVLLSLNLLDDFEVINDAVVLILLGTNDFLRFKRFNRGSFWQILCSLKDCSAMLIVRIPPIPLKPELTDDIESENQWISSFENISNIFFVDLPFYDEQNCINLDLFEKTYTSGKVDLIHLNCKGLTMLAESVLKLLQSIEK